MRNTMIPLVACAMAFSAAHAVPARHSAAQHKTRTVRKAAAPDVIFFNGLIYTGEGFAVDRPQVVEAMAIRGGRVVAVGKTADVKKLAGPHTTMRDMKGGNGAVIFPGFNDAHVHLGSAGLTKLTVELHGVGSLKEMLDRVKAAADAAPAGQWLTGGGWDHTLWADQTLPTREDLDAVTKGHPAFFERVDGHIAVANSAALAAAGITGRTKSPLGGAIDLDANGKPTGIVRDTATGLVERVIPAPSEAMRRKGDQLAIADAIEHGVTSVQDFSDWKDFLVYEDLEREGELPLRITEWLPFKDPLPELKRMRAHHSAGDPMLHTGFLKGFMDGSLGSRTAVLKEPYSDDTGNRGLPRYTQSNLNRMTVERAKAGFQIGFHAIGDKAVEMALEAFSQPGVSHTARNRIEHAQVVDPKDIPRFKKLGVIASMQPSHVLTDMNWAEARLGLHRAEYSYAWKSFLDAGVPLAFGTDYPVEPITPFRGVYAAVTRTNEAGTMTYFPAEAITRGEALYAYMQGAAYAEFAEKHKGELEPGYDADFIVVDRDLYTVPPRALLGTQVLETWVAGKQ
ncbi:MAG TPA: amidohydrolase family protein, partial [Terracidiphilus sp.]|nr:amidohydrolase family protein [Terracidiphilus sp.]